MRVDMAVKTQDAHGPSTTFAGESASQPMMSFATGHGIGKWHFDPHTHKRKNSQQASMYYPFVHMVLHRWFATQLPDEYMKMLQHPQFYVTVLLNCWSRIHGGQHKPETKIAVVNGHDTCVSHLGQFSGGHFLAHLSSSQVKAAKGVGAKGKCVSAGEGEVVVNCNYYEWGAPDFVPPAGDPLSDTANGVPATAMYAVSAQNVVLATSSAIVHGSSDMVLDTANSLNPAKFTVVGAVRGSPQDNMYPADKDAIAIYSNKIRVHSPERPTMPPIVRVVYE